MARTETSVNPPRQARSRDTLERFARAAVDLLNHRPWSRISVAELADAAGSSVGAFYTRFADKDALLEYLDARYADELIAFSRRHRDLARRRGLDAGARAEHLLRGVVRLFRRYRGLLVTVVLEARISGKDSFAARTRRMNAELPELVGSFREVLPSCSPEEIRVALAFTFSALRDQLLFPDSVPAFSRTPRDAALIRALTRNFLGYLGRS